MNIAQIKELIRSHIESGSKSLNEYEAKKIFAEFEIPVVREIAAEDEKELAAACGSIGFPLVLKGMGPHILHKTEAGLVCVGLADEDQVIEKARRMKLSCSCEITQFLVQPVVKGKRELTAGMFRDPQFGPVIALGLGGILTEALNDIVFKIAPLDDADMDDMFDQLASKRLLGEFRGDKPVDMKALKRILKGLSDIALEFDEIGEIDINPVIIDSDGQPCAVDGLILLQKPVRAIHHSAGIDFTKLKSCYYPESIAFIGASATPGKWGHMLLTNTLSRNYNGRVYLVNPKGGKIAGRSVYRSAADIEDNIDLAVVTVPAKHVIDLIPDLEKKNTRGMLVITSGFREIGHRGRDLEKKLADAASKAGIVILGPNTMGICNPHMDFYCCAAHAYPRPGSTALVCQSGNMGTQLLAFAEQQDIGIRAFSGSGNEAMVTIEDYMEAFEVDDLTKTVVLYIESVKDGSRFFRSAKRVSCKKPVVVLKGGRTDTGTKAASSHTGAMASDANVFNAACRQAGIIQVNQPMELLDLSAVFSSLPLPQGNRVAIMTLGGGWGVITTDLCAEHGLEVPELPLKIIERLDKILPPFWSRGNPVDIVGEGDPEIPKTCLEELLKWDGCDAVIHLGIHGKRVLVNNMIDSVLKTDPDINRDYAQIFRESIEKFEQEYTRYVIKLTHAYKKPVLGVSLLTDEISRTLYRLDGYEYKSVFFPSPERAVKALWGMCRYQNWCKTHA